MTTHAPEPTRPTNGHGGAQSTSRGNVEACPGLSLVLVGPTNKPRSSLSDGEQRSSRGSALTLGMTMLLASFLRGFYSLPQLTPL